MTLQQFINHLQALAEDENAFDLPLYFRIKVGSKLDESISDPIVTCEKRIVRGEYVAKIKVRTK